jgi:hypothetical protein
MMLRDASELLYPAVSETIAVLKLDPDGQDAAAAKLAQQYARTIDRAALTGKKPSAPDAKPNGLAALRAARSS